MSRLCPPPQLHLHPTPAHFRYCSNFVRAFSRSIWWWHDACATTAMQARAPARTLPQVSSVVIRDDSRLECLIVFVPSRATTTVSAVLRAGTACGPRSSFATLFSDVRTRLASICRNEVIRSQLGRRLWKWRSPRGYRCEYQFDLELTCPASAQLATACRLRLRRIHRH